MSKALICRQSGEWHDVLSLEELKLPPEVAKGFSRVRMLAAAIHPSDFGMIAGTYGKAKVFPCAMGREGVGEVIALGRGGSERADMGPVGPKAPPQNIPRPEGGGRGVGEIKVGDIVRIPEELGVWQEVIDCQSQNLFICPKDLKPEQLALGFINPPTALRILEDFAALKPGDAVITNAGKSAVSQSLIQLGRDRGLKVHAVVRGKTEGDESWLKSIGAAAVWDETQEYFKEVKAALALNQVGGPSVLGLIKALADHGVCVTIGGASKELVRYPTRELIFKDAQLRGFWWDRYLRENPAKVRPIMEEIWELMRKGKLTQEIAGKYKLTDYAKALTQAEESRRGKVIFVW
jgi:trans-2-enoyl-CoA reductase